MSSLSFFPSRTMALYVGKMFLVRSFAILILLVLVLQTLDLLGESGKILAVPGNGDAEIWRYVGYRLPQLIARFLPFSILLGTIITLATLNQNSEVISMKAAGMSAHQVLAPLLIASLLVAGLSFAFNERIVTRANAALARWQKADYEQVTTDSGVKSNVWVRSGDDLINVRDIRGTGTSIVLEGVSIYRRPGNSMTAILRADSAKPDGDSWALSNVSHFDVAAGTVTKDPTQRGMAGLVPEQFTTASVKGDELPFSALRSAIDELKAAGRATGPQEAAYWHKISGPLSTVLMPLLGAVAAFGLARSGKLFVRAILGMALGFFYFVADNFAMAMGNMGAYDPLLAAWGPFVLFLLIGEAVLFRTEE